MQWSLLIICLNLEAEMKKSIRKKRGENTAINKLIILILIVIVIVVVIVTLYRWGYLEYLKSWISYGNDTEIPEIPNDCEFFVGKISNDGYISVNTGLNDDIKLTGTNLYFNSKTGVITVGKTSVGKIDSRLNEIEIYLPYLDINSPESLKTDIFNYVSANSLALLNGAYKASDVVLCKTNARMQIIKNSETCRLSCSVLNGVCRSYSLNQKMVNLRDSGYYYYTEGKYDKIYDSNDEYTNLYLDSDLKYIYSDNFFADSKVGEVDYTSRKVKFYSPNTEIMTALDGSFVDVDQKFKIYSEEKELNSCSSGEVSIGTTEDCKGLHGEKACCVKVFEEKISDNGLNITQFEIKNKNTVLDLKNLKVNADETYNINFGVTNVQDNTGKFFCYALRSDTGTLVLDYPVENMGAAYSSYFFRPKTEKVLKFVAWDLDSKKVYKTISVNVVSASDGKTVSDDNFKQEIWNSKPGDSFYSYTRPVAMKITKTQTINLEKFWIKILDNNEIEIYSYYKSPKYGEKWHILDCNTNFPNGAHETLTLERVESSLTASVAKNCEVYKDSWKDYW